VIVRHDSARVSAHFNLRESCCRSAVAPVAALSINQDFLTQSAAKFPLCGILHVDDPGETGPRENSKDEAGEASMTTLGKISPRRHKETNVDLKSKVSRAPRSK